MFDSNSASNSVSGDNAYGGAIYASAGSSNTDISSTSFTDNYAHGSTGTPGLSGSAGGTGGGAGGGAIEYLSESLLTITNSTFTGNKAYGGPGGIGSGSGSGGAGGNGTGSKPPITSRFPSLMSQTA